MFGFFPSVLPYFLFISLHFMNVGIISDYFRNFGKSKRI